jgi:hypothetical protein
MSNAAKAIWFGAKYRDATELLDRVQKAAVAASDTMYNGVDRH